MLVRRDGGEAKKASGPSSLFWKGIGPQPGMAPTGDGQLPRSAAGEEPRGVSSAEGNSASSGQEINIYHGSPLSSQTLGSWKKKIN